jgi:hypothetical protein
MSIQCIPMRPMGIGRGGYFGRGRYFSEAGMTAAANPYRDDRHASRSLIRPAVWSTAPE